MAIQGNLVLNPEFETLDPGVPVFDDWDDSVVGAGTVAANAVDQRFGLRCLGLSTTAGPGDEAQVITSAHIPVDRTVQHVFRFNYATVAGALNDFTATIVQYNAAGVDLVANIDVNPAPSAVWAVSRTTILANTLDVDCTQIDILLLVDDDSNQWLVDLVSFAAVDNAAMSVFGTPLYVGGYAVGELTYFGGPGLSGETVDVTSHQSPAAALNAAAFREYVAGVKDGGSVSLEGNFMMDPTQDEFVADLSAGTLAVVDIFYPGAIAEWSFTGILSGFEQSAAFDDKLGFSGSVKVSGVPVLLG
jgi:hypothetical protein